MRHLKLGLLAAILLGITAASSANLAIPGSNDVTSHAEIMQGPALAYNGGLRMRRAKTKISAWPNGVVPVLMSGSVQDRAYLYAVTAMREIESNTKHGDEYCVRFRNKTSADYAYLEIDIENKNSCLYYIKPGYRGRGKNTMQLGGCTRLGDFLERFVHVLGMIYEHQRPDRDQYVDIHEENIHDSAKPFFNKYQKEQIEPFFTWTHYDFSSITEIGSNVLSKSSSKPTITIKQGRKIPRNKYMSRQDVARVQRFYKCNVDLTHVKKPVWAKRKFMATGCSFSTIEGFCAFRQDSNDDLDWQIGSGSEKGPRAVSSNGKGQFAYVQTEGHSGKIARLTLRNKLGRGQYCMHMDIYGDPNGGGDFKINSEVRAGTYTFVGTNSRKAGEWQAIEVHINRKVPWDLVLEYTVGTGESSDFAIDQLGLLQGACPKRDAIIR